MLAAEAELDRKVHGSSSSGSALAALRECPEYRTNSVERRADTSDSTLAHASTSLVGAPPPPTPPVDIAVGPSHHTTIRSGSSGRLSFLGCFSTSGKNTVLGDEDVSLYQATCEVGIRPSFYWVDTESTEEQRLETEATMRFMKADCQDEARVIQNFARTAGLTFIGVFDGHGPNGRAAAKLASDRLPIVLEAQMAARGKGERKRLKAMREACRQVDSVMNDHKQAGFDASLSGTTACFALVEGSRVLLANVGDSRCVMARQTLTGDSVESIPLTEDAKPQLPAETQRIVACGGIVRQLLDESGQRSGAHRVFCRGDDVLPGLAMSRSLGDSYAHSVGVTWEPALSAHTLTPRDQFLLLGTDGLWDVMDNAAAVDFVERYRHRRDSRVSCAEALTLEAQERWKAAHDEALVDDISVAILHMAPLPPPELEASLPQSIARAASCNDEANALWSAWKQGTADDDPSNHSPRKFFEHLYSEDGVVASAPAVLKMSSSSLLVAAAAEEGEESETINTEGETEITDISPPAVFGLGTLEEEPLAGKGVAFSMTGRNASASTPPSAPVSLEQPAAAPRPSLLAADQYGALASSSTRASPSMAIPQRSSGSRPIPTAGLSMANSAPVAGAGGLVDVQGLMRPIRKAYPSTNLLPSVPSWDGTFYHSFKSDLSPSHDVDTPRSSESNGSGHGAGGEELRHEGRVHRGGELRHEGKVHRGIPRSYSSNGLASHGRMSTDSDVTSQGNNSQVGSLEERFMLGSGRPPQSPMRAPLPRSRSDAMARSLSSAPLMLTRPKSYSALASMYSGPTLSPSPSSGRVIVVRDVHGAAAGGGGGSSGALAQS